MATRIATLGLGWVEDRWALDEAGPLPSLREEIAIHTARDVTGFIMARFVLVHEPMRNHIMDGAPERNCKVIEELVAMLQAKQMTPVPYSPVMLGLVKRFHRTEDQRDWDTWLPCGVYAYNGARHTTTGYPPSERFMERRFRAPNELLRTGGVTQIESWAGYHKKHIAHMSKATEIA
ncbi:Cyclic AMP-dependent protein kinase [Phytophthora megakarya]|uniref:Cyclic AMP-dependent protein kinase n=1 Tax=Phytophthora megakarya TaxID=4795 RepID=A0A225WYT8_9STRA|nr:Cyclic AMP-dependent protein kinase [Phytophthora megakarya]